MPTSRVRATVDSERADHESWLKMISELPTGAAGCLLAGCAR
ncbi:hypothetical protein [Liquorilactobacillus sucicola]|nr:hypothetical protein [Liquorilactobacillus sucicola]